MDLHADHSFTAYVGIDWADAKHDVCFQAAGCDQREFTRFSHQVDSIEAWAHSMYQRFGGRIAVALELAKGPIIYALQKHDFIVLFPVNPSMLAKYREAFKPSRAKDDPTDAELALDLLVRHPERFEALRPQSVEMRTLTSLVEQRRQLVNDKIRLTNRLRSALKQYYPQALEWITSIHRFSATSSRVGRHSHRSSEPAGAPLSVFSWAQHALRSCARSAAGIHQGRHSAHLR